MIDLAFCYNFSSEDDTHITSMCGELEKMHSTLIELEKSVLVDWTALRVGHKKLINSRQTWMRTPTEVWMYIFEIACLAIPSQSRAGEKGNSLRRNLKKTRLALTSTCVSWRLIARSTRSLWSPIFIDSPVSAREYDNLMAQIELAANRPFEIRFDDRKYRIDMGQIMGFESAFQRCRILGSQVTRQFKPIFLAFQSPHLTCAHLEWSQELSGDAKVLDFRKATALQHLSLRFGNCWRYPTLKLPDNNRIVDLFLKGRPRMELSDVIAMLNGCPLLETLVLTAELTSNQPLTTKIQPLHSLRNLSLHVSALGVLAKSPLIPNVHRFKLSTGPCGPQKSLDLSSMHQLKLPLLHCLEIHDGCSRGCVPLTSITRFIENNPRISELFYNYLNNGIATYIGSSELPIQISQISLHGHNPCDPKGYAQRLKTLATRLAARLPPDGSDGEILTLAFWDQYLEKSKNGDEQLARFAQRTGAAVKWRVDGYPSRWNSCYFMRCSL